jgi:hypothetical protein
LPICGPRVSIFQFRVSAFGSSLFTRHCPCDFPSSIFALGLVTLHSSLPLPSVHRIIGSLSDFRLPICGPRVSIFQFRVSAFGSSLFTRHCPCDFPSSIFALGLVTRHSSLVTALAIGSSGLCWLSTDHKALPPARCSNSLSFHQHRQRAILTSLFSSTSRETGKRTFFLYLFSITSRD